MSIRPPPPRFWGPLTLLGYSMHVQHLPFVFVLIMTSPPTPSYLQSTYPRSTLALLRVHQVSAPTGVATVRDVLTKVRLAESPREPILTLLLSGILRSRLRARHHARYRRARAYLQLRNATHRFTRRPPHDASGRWPPWYLPWMTMTFGRSTARAPQAFFTSAQSLCPS